MTPLEAAATAVLRAITSAIARSPEAIRHSIDGDEFDGREWKQRPHVAPMAAREKQGEML